MTSPIQPVSLPGVTPGRGASAFPSIEPEEPRSGFAQAITDALASVGRMEQNVQAAAEAAAVGDIDSVTDFMVTAAEAQLATEITVAVRDRAISAFTDIMRMQI